MSTAETLGGGLVEISAVVTIIGAPIAEALIHGLKAACGMSWAPMSSFGVIHVAKACLSAAVPDWLRESMGLRNSFVDDAIGVMLRIDHTKQAKNRVDMGDACAIQVVTPRTARYIDGVGAVRGASGGARAMLSGTRRRQHSKTASAQMERGVYDAYFERPSQWIPAADDNAMCIYTLDRSSQLALDTAAAAQHGEAIKIHRFIPDVEGILPVWKDWAVLLASMAKVAEAATLRTLGSERLWYWTMCGWLHAFVSALLLQLLQLGRDNPLRPGSDIAAGSLPSPLHLGGSGKIVLGVPTNVRRHPLWRSLLGLGVIFNVAGIIGTFLYLGREPPIVTYVWIGFQGLWLVSRIVVFYFVEGAAAGRQGISVSKSWEDSSDQDRRCVMTLLSELSKHQVSIHPRGAHAYRHDCLSLEELCSHFAYISWSLRQSLPTAEARNRTLDIKTVAGDTLIWSIVWFTGAATLSNSDLYDACVVFVSCAESNDQNKTEKVAGITTAIAAIPCVRVFACSCARVDLHRHGRADCEEVLEWLYFIPTAGDEGGGITWTFAHGLTSESLSDEELHSQLENGRWNISLNSSAELKSALEVSRAAARLLVDMLKSVRVQVQVGAKTPLVKVESSDVSV